MASRIEMTMGDSIVVDMSLSDLEGQLTPDRPSLARLQQQDGTEVLVNPRQVVQVLEIREDIAPVNL